MCQINQGDSRALLCINFSSPLFLYTGFKKKRGKKLLIWYVVITIHYSYYHYWSSIIPMILIINILLFEYGMALSCDCVFLTVLKLSAEECTPTETQTVDGQDFWVLLFLPRGMCSSPSQKQAHLFSWWTPSRPHPTLILLKRRTLYRWEREVLYLQTEVTVLFVQHGFWNLSDFSETRIPS